MTAETRRLKSMKGPIQVVPAVQLILFTSLFVAGLFIAIALTSLMALGGGLILNAISGIGLAPGTFVFLGTAGVVAFIVGLVFINDHLRKISTSDEDEGWGWEEEDAQSGQIMEEQDSPLTPKMPAVGRNHPCPCNSGKKYKHCCLKRFQEQDLEPDDIPF